MFYEVPMPKYGDAPDVYRGGPGTYIKYSTSVEWSRVTFREGSR